MFLNIKLFKKYLKLSLIFYFLVLLNVMKIKRKKKIGVICVRHEVNVGNNLLKYAIFIVLKNLGYTPYIIGTHWDNFNISFINKTTNLVVIKKNFTEIKEDDYDILMVNSDQTWRNFDENFYDYAFLKFAKNWKIKKFVYGASLGFDYWKLTRKDEEIAKQLLKDFKGISIREKGSVELVKKHFGINPTVVIDPTLLIDKKYYLNIINNFTNKINYNYIFIYGLFLDKIMLKFINKASKLLNYTIYDYVLNNQTNVENFLYLINNSKAVITNSYHGTIFSIIFNKPFISFNYKQAGKERMISLGKLFGCENRIFNYNESPNYKLLNTSLKINDTLINLLRIESINFIKKNLE